MGSTNAGSPQSDPFALSETPPVGTTNKVLWMAALFALMVSAVAISPAMASPKSADQDHDFVMSQEIDGILDFYCYSCHDDTQKGDIRLDQLAGLENSKRLDLLNRMQEQVYFGHMPPKKKDQPSEEERKALLDMLSVELAAYQASTLEGKLRKPEFGNYVDHDKLFSGDYRDLPSSTPDRRWLISEFIFNAKFQRILDNRAKATRSKKRFEVLGSQRFSNFSLTNPFLLPQVSGVRYYANEDLTGGHLSSMLTNAQKVSQYITDDLVKQRNGKYLPAIREIMALEDQHRATLVRRREFLQDFIAILCEEIYGDQNEALLPAFKPVTLKPVPKLAEGETYQKAPTHVALNTLKGLDAEEMVFQFLMDPRHGEKSDEDFREFCDRTWFYRGDHERTIQGRMTILRDYLPELREHLEKARSKIKPLEYKPLAEDEMAVVRAAIRKNREEGDHYGTIIENCLAAWEQEFQEERLAAGPPSNQLLADLVDQLSTKILERSPTAVEAEEYVNLARSYVAKLGNLKAIQKLIQTFILSSEFVYRQEFGTGPADAHGRRLLSPRDASYAIAYALTDQSPDEELVKAAREGRLETRDDYRREVLRILNQKDRHYLIDPILEDRNFDDNLTNLPIRKLRFFREFFGYPAALTIFKDEKRFGGDRLDQSTNRLVNEADRTIENILEKDENVFEELIGSEKFYVYHDGDEERMRELSEHIKSIFAYFKDLDWENFTKEDLAKHSDFLRKVKMRHIDPDDLDRRFGSGTTLQHFKRSMASITARLDKGQKHAAPFDLSRGYGTQFMWGGNVAKFWGFRKDDWHWSPEQPMKVPNRKGILTHPAWLVAHAFNTETDPVHRGKFVREKLLAGTIPDVPITVDAVIPEDHHKTLRSRLASATETSSCWKCHELMNPLGYAFESYDDFGRFRVRESLEYPEHLLKKQPDTAPNRNHLIDLRDTYKTLPVDPSGFLEGTGDESLDGELKDAIDLAERLSKSRRVRQSIIRHAFRYFLGRNEVLADSKTLIDAEQAYRQSGGSFDAVIVSLLTSDSFIYRKSLEN